MTHITRLKSMLNNSRASNASGYCISRGVQVVVDMSSFVVICAEAEGSQPIHNIGNRGYEILSVSHEPSISRELVFVGLIFALVAAAYSSLRRLHQPEPDPNVSHESFS